MTAVNTRERRVVVCQMSFVVGVTLKMLLKLLCVLIVCHDGVADDLVTALTADGRSRVALCLGAERGECEGALWRRQWVVARAACLQHAPMYRVLVTSPPAAGGAQCHDFYAGMKLSQASKVVTRFVHPQYRAGSRAADLALVVLERAGSGAPPALPAGSGAPPALPALPANTSRIHHLLSEFEPWMEEMYQKYPTGPRRISYKHTHSLFSSPLRMFLTTVLLPSLSFMVFFLFVIFFTGSKEDIPYKTIEEEKNEDTQLGV